MEPTEDEKLVVVKANPNRKIVQGKPRTSNKIPQSILDDPLLNDAISVLPNNYNFEIHKTIWRAKEMSATRIALQMPEGIIRINNKI